MGLSEGDGWGMRCQVRFVVLHSPWFGGRFCHSIPLCVTPPPFVCHSTPLCVIYAAHSLARSLPFLWCLCVLLAQVIAACYALSLDLRLQVLWSAKSAIIPGGYNVDAMCRCVSGARLKACGWADVFEEGSVFWGGGRGCKCCGVPSRPLSLEAIVWTPCAVGSG